MIWWRFDGPIPGTALSSRSTDHDCNTFSMRSAASGIEAGQVPERARDGVDRVHLATGDQPAHEPTLALGHVRLLQRGHALSGRGGGEPGHRRLVRLHGRRTGVQVLETPVRLHQRQLRETRVFVSGVRSLKRDRPTNVPSSSSPMRRPMASLSVRPRDVPIFT
jgi:hypothetical protein